MTGATTLAFADASARSPARPGRARRTGLFPPLDRRTLLTLVLGGLGATVAWEVFARAIAPFWQGGPLEPAGLVMSVFGTGDALLAEAIHVLTGTIGFAAGYLFVAKPVADGLARLAGRPRMPSPIAGLGYGIALWALALYGMAHLVAGFPPFLGFAAPTWASLAGHVVYGVVLAAIVAARRP